MGIKRYVATKDSTITDAYKDNLTDRATNSNMGASDILEVFSIFGQATSTAVVTGTDLYTLENIFTSSVSQASDSFGQGHSRYEDIMAIGSPRWSGSYTAEGKVTVFRSSSIGWSEEATLLSSNPEVSSNFGWEVEAYENFILISKPHFSNTTDPSGSVELFHSNSSGWTSVQIFSGSNLFSGASQFGYNMDLDYRNNKLIVSAYLSSKAFIFSSGSSGWVEEAVLTGPAAQVFGNDVAIEEDYAVVGSTYRFDFVSITGSAYIFKSGSSGWVEEAILTSSESALDDYFGFGAISISSNKVLVGAQLGDGFNGSAYLFQSSSSGWSESQVFKDPLAAYSDAFGVSVRITGSFAVIGRGGGTNTPGFRIYEAETGDYIETQFITSSVLSYSSLIDVYRDSILVATADFTNGRFMELYSYDPIVSSFADAIESSRLLVEFPVTDIINDRAAGNLPASGSVSFYLNLSNAPHGENTPKDFDLVVAPISQSWTEGFGQDMESYEDLGPVNWNTASTGNVWNNSGGDYLSSPVYTSSFSIGDEDLNVDITELVESWISGTVSNNGLGVRLAPTYENSTTTSFFTKRFFGRRTEHFFKTPWIEARYNNAIKDNRNSFYASSSLVPASENLMTLFLYNKTRKGLKNIPSIGTGPIYMSLFSGTLGPSGAELLLHTGELAITGGATDTGIYTASVAIDTQFTQVWDVWHNNLTGSSRIEYFTGSVIIASQYAASDDFEISDYVLNITNLKPEYSKSEEARFRLFTRLKDWNPTIYTISIANIENEIIEEAYYRIFRVIDDFDVVPYNTGSDNATLLSYDKVGNYLDFDMSILESDYQYGIQFTFKLEDKYYEQPETFHFRVR